MKKIISLSLLALTLAFSLTGCEWLNNKIQEGVSGAVDDINSTMEEASQDAAESFGGDTSVEATTEVDATVEVK
ncbi:hypothetical protein COU74_02635 [Candidatus Peregrinibacteria bacterium CG10_big_fil_rev_8_21_14_0_10_36_19]|nr:MAG: hypothetical protein COU74_02635 [Candidatus Peregrinibacteria bacterium CG10_big_fil_rev_8_21_14_0_10_36_19]